jgi:hypothetical protein
MLNCRCILIVWLLEPVGDAVLRIKIVVKQEWSTGCFFDGDGTGISLHHNLFRSPFLGGGVLRRLPQQLGLLSHDLLLAFLVQCHGSIP